MNPETAIQPAQPVVRKKKWPYPLIWIVPAITAIGAGLYLKDFLFEHGPTIRIEFSDASGMLEKETKLKYRGAEVGRVTEIKLTEDHKHAMVEVQLQKREEVFASKGAVFWVVRPEVNETGLQGLGTILTGPYISATPGEGTEKEDHFEGASRPPKAYEAGEKFVLTSPKLGHVQEGSAVYYKGIPVGSVQDVELAKEADHIDVRILVWSRYAALVRENSKFWVTSGFDFKAGLFSGAELKLDSLKALISGGVAFVSPADKDEKGPAKPGSTFALEDDYNKDWDKWSPHIRVHPRGGDSVQKPVRIPKIKKEESK